MKNWYLTLFACLLSFGVRGEVAPMGLTVVSQQGPATGSLSFQVLAEAQGNGSADYRVQVQSPTLKFSNVVTSPTVPPTPVT